MRNRLYIKKYIIMSKHFSEGFRFMVMVLKMGASELRRVEFFTPGTADEKVMLAGSFNDWEPEQNVMEYDPVRRGHAATLKLAPGEYEYKFVRGEEWLQDDGNPKFAANDFGTLNSVVKVD